jgi:hypothetical protein
LTHCPTLRQLAREAASAGHEHGLALGYARAIEDIKSTEHDVVRAVRLAGRRHVPGGEAWLAAVERNGGTEYDGEGLPRAPVSAEVIARARDAARSRRAA